MAIRVKLIDKLKAENSELKKELDDVRKGGQQTWYGLAMYAKKSNWQQPHNHWVGEGDGPAMARKFLGLDTKELEDDFDRHFDQERN